MAGRRSLLTLLTGISAGCLAVSSAQPPPPLERPQGERPPRPEPPKRMFPHMGPEGDAMRERMMRELQKLSPEKRADLWRAVWAVLNLPPEKRQMLLGMDDDRRRIAREEIERAISDNGLQLDEDRKQAFVRRYFEERRTIEEALRRESDEKRRQLIGAMRERLRQEFGGASGAPVRTGGAK